MDNQENKVSEKQVPKKPSLAKSIFKWLFVGVLAFFLIAAIIFQAPWKVLTLLVIFLLACTALPRPLRKWFWVSVGVVVLVLIIWVFLPESNEGWRPYTFDEELAALQAKYAIPDSENAALIYNQLLDSYASTSFDPNFADWNLEYLILHEPWSSEDYPQVAQWLQEHNNTIAKLLEASKVAKCRFPIPPNMMGLSPLMKRSPMMRRWAYLLLIAANNDIAEKRIEQALEKYAAVVQMRNHVCQQPTTIDMLVGNALEGLALGQFKRFIVTGNATEERLRIVESVLAEIKHDWSHHLSRTLEFEKLMMKSLLALLYETNSKGETRLSREPLPAIRAQLGQDTPSPTFCRRKLNKAGTILGWFTLPSTPQKAAKIIDTSFHRFYAMAEPDYDWRKEPPQASKRLKFDYPFMIKLLTDILEPSYHSVHDVYLRVVAEQRGCQIMIALRRYKNEKGGWPDSLEDIRSLDPPEIFVDPISGDAFVYRLTEENFTLYSKGKDNLDNNGEYPDDWPIWPSRYYRTKKEKADAE